MVLVTVEVELREGEEAPKPKLDEGGKQATILSRGDL